VKRPRLTAADRLLWAWLSEVWADWRSTLCIVKPETIIAWHRKGFRLFWTWKIRHGQPGRPPVSKETRGEAFPFEQIPRYLLRDRDRIFGGDFRKHVKAMGIKEVLSAPRSPWQRAYIERLIGTLRRECLDHVIVFSEASLYRHVKSFMAYYHESRTHLSLAKDTPEPRPVHLPEIGPVVAIPQVGGLHHRYERRTA